jgi:hypothetical protein
VNNINYLDQYTETWEVSLGCKVTFSGTCDKYLTLHSKYLEGSDIVVGNLASSI